MRSQPASGVPAPVDEILQRAANELARRVQKMTTSLIGATFMPPG
jgi:hypothetical protein